MATNIDTAIEYGLIRISEYVEDQLKVTEQSLTESLELLVIKKIIDNYAKSSELDDYYEFLTLIFDFLEDKYLSANESL